MNTERVVSSPLPSISDERIKTYVDKTVKKEFRADYTEGLRNIRDGLTVLASKKDPDCASLMRDGLIQMENMIIEKTTVGQFFIALLKCVDHCFRGLYVGEMRLSRDAYFLLKTVTKQLGRNEIVIFKDILDAIDSVVEAKDTQMNAPSLMAFSQIALNIARNVRDPDLTDKATRIITATKEVIETRRLSGEDIREVTKRTLCGDIEYQTALVTIGTNNRDILCADLTHRLEEVAVNNDKLLREVLGIRTAFSFNDDMGKALAKYVKTSPTISLLLLSNVASD